MGAGCLGPRRDDTPIYIQFIDQINSEAERADIEETTGTQTYLLLKEKISKKGQLRKLIDFLSAHRQHLSEAAQHSYRLMRQYRTFRSRMAALVIIEQLVDNLHILAGDIPIYPRNMKNSRTKADDRLDTRRTTDIEIKFENIVLQIFIELFTVEPRLRDRSMEILIKFTEKSANNLTAVSLVSDIFQKLVQQAKTTSDVTLIVLTFSRLLLKSDWSSIDKESTQQALKVFLAIWTSTTNDNVKQCCSQIVSTFIDKCMTSREYSSIFQVIFQIYDECYFNEQKMEPLEDRLLAMLKEFELRDQFLKEIFKHLIGYLSICDTQEVRAKWPGYFDLNVDSAKMRYPNILNKNTKNNGFLTIIRWISKRFIQINQLLSYSRSAIVSCFVFNISSYLSDNNLIECILTVFCQIVLQCDENSLALLMELLIEEVYQTKDDKVQQGLLLIKILKKSIQQRNFIESLENQQYQYYIRPIDPCLYPRIRNEIINLMTVIISRCTSPFPYHLLEALVVFINSTLECISIPNQSIRVKYYLVCSVVSMLRKIHEKMEVQLLLVLLRHLEELIGQQVVPNVQKYMEILLAYEINQILGQTKGIPEEMGRINLKIHTNTNELIQTLIDDFLLRHPNEPVLDKKEVDETKKYTQVKKMLERVSKPELKAEEVDLEFKAFENKKSTISQRSSNARTDESFLKIYGLIQNQDDPLERSKSHWLNLKS